mgnify:CR=1 FL=1
MAKRIGKFKITKRESALSAVDGAVITGNLDVSGTSTFGGVVTAKAGVLNSDVTVSSGTGAIDLTAIAADHKVYLTGTGAGQIKVPLATANNTGMCIEIYWTVDGATNGNQKLGVANSGSTVMTGVIILNSTGAKTDASSIHALVNDTKNLEFDADAADHCGGTEGTVVRLYYQAANKIFAEVRGITSAATPALDTNAASATGWS